MTLISPAMPAAPSRCPMLVLTDPTSSGRVAGRPGVKTAAGRAHLERITQGGAGAVCFDVIDVGRGQLRIGQGESDDGLLGQGVGRGESVTATVLIDGGAAEEGEDGVTLGLGIGQAFEQDDAAAFAAHEAVGGGGESLATPAR